MDVTVNGRLRSVPDGATVADLLRTLGASDRGSAVALDGSVVPRGEWPTRVLAVGDRVEILQAVQGG